MSQRIADSLEVLDLIQQLAKRKPTNDPGSWRKEAIAHVASRGVNERTVFAHLVGKNTAHTVTAIEMDGLITTWITLGSTDLEQWILKSCGKQDGERVSRFFLNEQSTPFAVDIGEPEAAEKHLVTTYRILRDTALARRIKADNDYTCQICGEQVMLNSDTPYAEAHHVKPLGNPHCGPDQPGNIVCVCPNCHVKLDYGAININQDTFSNVHPEFIRYHNEVIRRKVA